MVNLKYIYQSRGNRGMLKGVKGHTDKQTVESKSNIFKLYFKVPKKTISKKSDGIFINSIKLVIDLMFTIKWNLVISLTVFGLEPICDVLWLIYNNIIIIISAVFEQTVIWHKGVFK